MLIHRPGGMVRPRTGRSKSVELTVPVPSLLSFPQKSHSSATSPISLILLFYLVHQLCVACVYNQLKTETRKDEKRHYNHVVTPCVSFCITDMFLCCVPGSREKTERR